MAKIKVILVIQVRNSKTHLTLGVITFMTSKCGKQTLSAAIISMCQKSIRHAVNFYQKLRSCMAIMKFEKNHQILKGGLFSESILLLDQISQKSCQKLPIALSTLSKEKILRRVFRHLFWENFLRSIHL